MDEAAFTYTEKVVYNYNYYMEVTRWELLEKNIAYVEEVLTKTKARKPKTETGEARKEKEIAEYENRLRELKEKKEEWKREG
jgi:FMN-dependent NADH-azoreductase